MRLLPVPILALLWLAPVAAQARIAPEDPEGVSRYPGPAELQDRRMRASLHRDLRATRERIEDDVDSGAISRKQGRALKREARRIGSLVQRFGRDGLSDSEQRDLDMQVRGLDSLTMGERTRAQSGKP